GRQPRPLLKQFCPAGAPPRTSRGGAPLSTLRTDTEDRTVAKAQDQDPWRGFKPGLWQRDVNVRWFLQQNYTPYEGDDAFLAAATDRTRRVWNKLEKMFVEERKKGVLD